MTSYDDAVAEQRGYLQMSINFPKLHVATSVTNRILNIAKEIDERYPMPQPALPTPINMPNVPQSVAAQGEQLNAQLGVATPEMPPQGDAGADAATTAALTGDTPLNGLLQQ